MGVVYKLFVTGSDSDINAAIHGWNNPVASISITLVGDDSDNGPTGVTDLSGQVYSNSAVEIFWQPAVSTDSIVTGYEVKRNGELVQSFDGLSFFDEGLNPGVEYTYNVRAIDANGTAGMYQSVVLRTNAN